MDKGGCFRSCPGFVPISKANTRKILQPYSWLRTVVLPGASGRPGPSIKQEKEKEVSTSPSSPPNREVTTPSLSGAVTRLTSRSFHRGLAASTVAEVRTVQLREPGAAPPAPIPLSSCQLTHPSFPAGREVAVASVWRPGQRSWDPETTLRGSLRGWMERGGGPLRRRARGSGSHPPLLLEGGKRREDQAGDGREIQGLV